MPKQDRGTKIGTGIYRSSRGYRVTYQSGGRMKESPWLSLEMTPAQVKAWRDYHVKHAMPAPSRAIPRDCLNRDIVRYLRTIKATEGYESARSHLKAWLPKFGRRSRFTLTLEEFQLQIAAWLGDHEVSVRTIRHRFDKLRQVYNLLDVGRKMPIHFVKLPKPPKTRPKGVADDIIIATARRLAEQERQGKLRDGKTRARFLVQATCGKRPCQVKRATPEDVDFVTRIWDVRPAKGSLGGELALNDEMLAAWQSFAAADAWGDYDSRSFSKTLKRNGWPDDVRPYQMRHQTLQTLNRRLPDFFKQVQQAANHTNARTTREHYVPPDLATSRASSEALAGRFADDLFAETRRHRTGIRVGGTSQSLGASLGAQSGSTVGARPTVADPVPVAVTAPKDCPQGPPKPKMDNSGIIRKSVDGSRLVRRPAESSDPSKTA